MLKKVRIYGERNSGTNFITKLLTHHFPIEIVNNKYIVDGDVTRVVDWKHETPNEKTDESIIDILVVRSLRPWLKSFYKTQWHLEHQEPFAKFLVKPLKISNEMSSQLTSRPNQKTVCGEKFINFRDENLTIFDLRYLKWNKFYKYFLENKNVVLLKVDIIQTDMFTCNKFLKEMNEKYKFIPMDKFMFKPVRTYKSGEKEYVPQIQKNFTSREEFYIRSKIDQERESQIDELKYCFT